MPEFPLKLLKMPSSASPLVKSGGWLQVHELRLTHHSQRACHFVAWFGDGNSKRGVHIRTYLPFSNARTQHPGLLDFFIIDNPGLQLFWHAITDPTSMGATQSSPIFSHKRQLQDLYPTSIPSWSMSLGLDFEVHGTIDGYCFCPRIPIVSERERDRMIGAKMCLSREAPVRRRLNPLEGEWIILSSGGMVLQSAELYQFFGQNSKNTGLTQPVTFDSECLGLLNPRGDDHRYGKSRSHKTPEFRLKLLKMPSSVSPLPIPCIGTQLLASTVRVTPNGHPGWPPRSKCDAIRKEFWILKRVELQTHSSDPNRF
ncbi:hypothetical protein C8J57DRAFT_1534907 [Mycena rebaudengoi]|nr:hypothetical protein C8J57DRAFT_1534907 [Mycena rebaudengoi]